MRRRLRDGRDGRALVGELERIGDGLAAGPEKASWFLELGVACEMLVPERQRALSFYRRAAELGVAEADNDTIAEAGNDTIAEAGNHTIAEAIERGRMVSRELGRVDELIYFTELELRH